LFPGINISGATRRGITVDKRRGLDMSGTGRNQQSQNNHHCQPRPAIADREQYRFQSVPHQIADEPLGLETSSNLDASHRVIPADWPIRGTLRMT
jgi:hypothetical protein